VSKILIGDKAGFDLDALLRTRLLIQANSGGGKSFTIRRIVEQAFSKVQIIVIDPEGEFVTLREKFGFALLGKGGEITGDVRHAGFIAEKMLEFNASVICDLYEMKPHERPAWVKAFLTGLLNAPKNLWHPVIVVVDEAHKFCPERGKGEAESTEAMLALATTGRKRGFCAVFATQRLGKLNKDAAAELLNVLIGRTFMDIDRERAADILGIQRSGKAAFDETLRGLEPGQFYTLGPAISTKPELVMIGKVQTSHPESGGQISVKQPPTPEQVKSLLPKLADLPKGADEKAKTEAELRTQVRSLTAQLSARPKPEADAAAIERAVSTTRRESEQQLRQQQAVIDKLQARLQFIAEKAAEAVGAPLPTIKPVTTPKPNGSIPFMPSYTMEPRASVTFKKPIVTTGLSGPEQRIINAIAWLNSIGVQDPEQTAVAFLAGYTIGGGGYNNPRGALNTKGLVQYIPGDRIRLTDAGREIAEAPNTPLDAEELQRMVLERLPGPEQRILKTVIEFYPEAMTNDECAARAGYTVGSGGYNNPRGRLRTLGLIEYPQPNMVRERKHKRNGILPTPTPPGHADQLVAQA
jgi:uncharacterized protein